MHTTPSLRRLQGRADRRSARHRRDERQKTRSVLRGSDRFCRQAWIRFFSMNRHQRTVREKNEDAVVHATEVVVARRRGRPGGGPCTCVWTSRRGRGEASDAETRHRPSRRSKTLIASSADGSPSGASLHVTQAADPRRTCVEIKVLRLVRAESSHRPPRHRRDACSMAMPVPRSSTEPGRTRHHREMT